MRPPPTQRSRRSRLTVLAVLAAAGAWALPAPATAPDRPPPPRYLSLGDSLAAGWQPDRADGTDRVTADGYAHVLARRLAGRFPGLATTRLSCGGATTTTLMAGGASCQPRGEPGQLVRAERFLAAHPETVLVTVNIGDNDVQSCLRMTPPAIDRACVARGMVTLRRNLPVIARRLRAAAPRAARVVGILDYDQFLALWLRGARGRDVARRSVAIVLRTNELMAAIYRRAGIEVADAGTRFATADLKTPAWLPKVGRVPLAVARICAWTWSCSEAPTDDDDHANARGYAQIAAAVLDLLGPWRAPPR